MGADMIELDVRRGPDGQLLVHHDPIVERAVYVPTLTSALDACAPTVVNIEIKNDPRDPDFDAVDGIADEVVALLQARPEPKSRWLISSFNPATIRRVRQLDPSLATGFLCTRPIWPFAEIAQAGHRAVHPHHDCVDADLVQQARDAGLAINVWTVDDPDRMVALAALGVDCIITNTPDIAVEVLTPKPE